MKMVNRPMATMQLWEFILINKLHHRLRSYDVSTESFIGKSPERTFGSSITHNKHIFKEVPNTKPKQYILKSQQTKLEVIKKS